MVLRVGIYFLALISQLAHLHHLHVPVHVLTELVKQIGTSIGENIASCLRSAPAGDVTLGPSTIANLS